MAGILDSKARIMDFILTDEGRRQVRSGDLRIAFASFSDLGAFYEDNGEGVAEDANARIYFEASSRHQDRIVVESNLGVITPFITSDVSGTYQITNEQVEVTPDSPAYAYETLELTGSQVFEQSNDILLGITQNFKDNQIISNRDTFSATTGFEISDSTITFLPTEEVPIQTRDYQVTIDTDGGNFVPPGLASLDAFLFDRRFAHFPNFKYLPPVNKRGSGPRSGLPLGLYPNLNQSETLTYQELKDQLKGKPFKEIRFRPTSTENNIMIQPFEFNGVTGGMKKLVIIDFGVFPGEEGTTTGVHIYFLGKLIPSQDGSYKFLNIFTLEMAE